MPDSRQSGDRPGPFDFFTAKFPVWMHAGDCPALAGPRWDPLRGVGVGSMGPWGVGAATGGVPAGGAELGSRASEKGRTGRSSAEGLDGRLTGA